MCLFLGLLPLFSQTDTLLFNGFQTDFETLIFPNGNDTVWINLDEDGLADDNNRPQDWYITTDWGQETVPPGEDTNFVAASSSWLEGFLDGNRNWLITPPIVISDDQATLHWKSAPFQGFRYMDGYTVYISSATNDPSTGDFGDPIFRAAQMLPPLPDSSGAPLVNQTADQYLWSEGYLHADGFTLTDYFTGDIFNESIYTPLLEPHSYSLADFAGQTIYIAFLHDSDDDNLLVLDDILVLGNDATVGTAAPVDDLRFVIYPNPAQHTLNVMFRLDQPSTVRLYLADIEGKIIREGAPSSVLPAGEQYHRMPVSDLASGTYSLVLMVDGKMIVKPFIKS